MFEAFEAKVSGPEYKIVLDVLDRQWINRNKSKSWDEHWRKVVHEVPIALRKAGLSQEMVKFGENLLLINLIRDSGKYWDFLQGPTLEEYPWRDDDYDVIEVYEDVVSRFQYFTGPQFKDMSKKLTTFRRANDAYFQVLYNIRFSVVAWQFDDEWQDRTQILVTRVKNRLLDMLSEIRTLTAAYERGKRKNLNKKELKSKYEPAWKLLEVKPLNRRYTMTLDDAWQPVMHTILTLSGSVLSSPLIQDVIRHYANEYATQRRKFKTTIWDGLSKTNQQTEKLANDLFNSISDRPGAYWAWTRATHDVYDFMSAVREYIRKVFSVHVRNVNPAAEIALAEALTFYSHSQTMRDRLNDTTEFVKRVKDIFTIWEGKIDSPLLSFDYSYHGVMRAMPMSEDKLLGPWIRSFGVMYAERMHDEGVIEGTAKVRERTEADLAERKWFDEKWVSNYISDAYGNKIAETVSLVFFISVADTLNILTDRIWSEKSKELKRTDVWTYFGKQLRPSEFDDDQGRSAGRASLHLCRQCRLNLRRVQLK